MPEMPIGHESGGLHRHDQYTIWATMLAPNDAEERETIKLLMNVDGAAVALGDGGKFSPQIWPLPPGETARNDGTETLVVIGLPALRRLAHAPPLAEFFKRNTHGDRCGFKLLQALRLIEHLPARASLSNASKIAELTVAKWSHKSGKDLASSPAQFRADWDEYRPAAHLWAASFWRSISGLDKSDPLNNADAWLRFLALSEHIADRVTTHRHKNASKPTIDASTLWRVPRCLNLPAFELAKPPPFQDSELDAIG